MLVLLPEDEKPGFFLFGLFMNRIPADICSHLLTESIADPRCMAPEQTSSGQYEE